jgi:uncharacterized membrane protein YeaQ/YmgE (transglycosylase-associated protein family)
MTLLQFLVLLVVAAIVGSLGQALAGYRLGGCLVSIVLGFIGALLGFWLAQQLHLPDLFVLRLGSESFPIIWSIIGATIFAVAVGFINRRRWRY